MLQLVEVNHEIADNSSILLYEVESIYNRISQLSKLRLGEGLYLLKEAAIGFQRLTLKFGHFDIN